MANVLDDLLKSIESDLNIARRDLAEFVDPIRAALESYERAVLEEHVERYCKAHSLRRPKTAGIPVTAAAHALLHSVRALPQLKNASPDGPGAEKPGAEKPSADEPPPPAQAPAEPEPEEDPVVAAFAEKFPGLTREAKEGRLLVFGAFSGRTKQLPGPLAEVTDWIDTATDGNRMVSAAVRRITTGGVFGIIICDQAISHQHSDPATRAARNQKIPIAYAGKGGNASLARALEALEDSLEQSE